ncbi:MAG: hypothetical protein NTV40_10070 [Solirubrobacterales bacterium]|nr:hypothetical protein [Solirubrobacterales bacterium]
MAWVETVSNGFKARHESNDQEGAVEVLGVLDSARTRLEGVFARPVEGDITVVIHASMFALSLAQPYLPLARRATAPSGRRYLVGWFTRSELHVLSPAALRRRASSVQGSKEMLKLAPAALYAHLTIGANNPDLPPPFTPASFRQQLRWGWLAHGAAQYFSGQIDHVRPAIARRLRDGSAPRFPPAMRDAPLLGGSVFDLLVSEQGKRAAISLATLPLAAGGSDAALSKAFSGRSLGDTEGVWRAHLSRLASQ